MNNMGTCHSDTAAHILGNQNVLVDLESRRQNIDTEWMLNSAYLFDALSVLSFLPTIDLFASRQNKQFPFYVSHRPDPYAVHVDAFTVPQNDSNFYSFPPFSCIFRVLQKVIQVKAVGVVVVPDWPTRP